MTTPTDRVRAALDQLINYAQDSNGNQYGSLCAILVEHIAQQALSELDGMVLVPIKETDENTIVFAMERSCCARPSIDDETYVMAIRDEFIAPYVEGEKE